MKKFLFTLSFLFTMTVSVFCQADTISFWHVFLDNKLMNEFSMTTNNPVVEIRASDINRNSILAIEYFRDTPCNNCPTYLIIFNSKDNRILKVKGDDSSNKHTLKLRRLNKMYSNGKESIFKIYFSELPYQDQYLFTLTIRK